jgi:hypothetical protein
VATMRTSEKHRHCHSRGDRRGCWDCHGQIRVASPCCLGMVEKVATMLGWRFLETEGRMVCPECATKRRAKLMLL